jgi:hypothetical protein
MERLNEVERLNEELKRLYLPDDAPGQPGAAARLTTRDGRVRALAIPFVKVKGDAEGRHWQRLCEVANGLQSDLGLPAPAVSIDGVDGYRLWLSFATPVAPEQARRFLALLHDRYCPDTDLTAAWGDAPVELPPGPNTRSGKWAAFVHPGMGASFADDPGLAMPPPLAGQVAFLEGLESIAAGDFAQALARLEPAQPTACAAPHAATQAGTPPAQDAFPGKLLLRDATLGDIVRFLHAQGIEPTFRYPIR